jgi:hypothetical protein
LLSQVSQAAKVLGDAAAQAGKPAHPFETCGIPHYERLRLLDIERAQQKRMRRSKYVWAMAAGAVCGLTSPHWLAIYQDGLTAKPFFLAFFTGILFGGAAFLVEKLLSDQND